MAEVEGSVDSGSAGQSAAGSEALDQWTRLKEADSAETFAAVWLEINCAPIKGLRRAVVVLAPRDRGPFAPVAVWPVGVAGSRPLAAAAESAIKERNSQTLSGSAQAGEQGRKHDVIAIPVTVDGKVYGSVAVEVEHDLHRDTRALISSLEWSSTWLEAFVRGHWTPPSDRLVTVLESIATTIHHRRFQEAVTAAATELAGRLGCERVCIGFLKGKHTELKGVSHSASFGKKIDVSTCVEARG